MVNDGLGTSNSASGEADVVVQSATIDQVHIRSMHDGRGIIALTAVVLLLIGAGVYVWASSRGADDLGVPLAAVSALAPKNDCETGWVLPGDTRLPIPITDRPPGAVLVTGGTVTVTVQGLVDDSVVLQGMAVEVVKRSPPLEGSFLRSGCGSDVPRRFFVIDLDSAWPTPVAEEKTVGFPYKVGGSDPEVFVITPLSPTEDVEWRLRIHWTSGSRRGELVVDDGGAPFRTTATTAAQPYCRAERQWIPGGQC